MTIWLGDYEREHPFDRGVQLLKVPLSSERYFQHSEIKFVSPRGHLYPLFILRRLQEFLYSPSSTSSGGGASIKANFSGGRPVSDCY